MRTKQPNELSFLEHIEVLRWHLMRSIAAVLVFAIVAFAFKSYVFENIVFAPMQPDFATNIWLCEMGEQLDMESLCINQQRLDMQSNKLSAQLMAHISVSMVLGFFVAFPYVFFEFWRFLKPALNKREVKHSRGAVFFASVLFSLGAAFGYFLISPLSFEFLGNYSVSESVKNDFLLESYISTFTSVVLASGVVFELPVLIFFLAKIGLVGPDFLKKYRKHSFVIILILAAIITPPDIFSQILVTVPLIILYEISIIIAKRIERKAQKKLETS